MKKLYAALAIVCVIATGCGVYQANAESKQQKKRFSLVSYEKVQYDGLLIISDNQTGVMYLVYDGDKQGGITVLVDADGKPLIWEGDKA